MTSLRRVMGLATGLLVTAFGVHSETSTMQDAQHRLETAVALARQFESSQEPEDLRRAGLALEGVDPAGLSKPEERIRLREVGLAHWLGLLQVAERASDPGFDPARVPVQGVSPPRTADGMAYPPGVDPARITDSRARAAYEQALVDNRRYAEHYRRQVVLLQVIERLTARTTAFLQAQYRFPPAEREAARSLILKAGLSPMRRDTLLAACYC